MIIFDNDLKEMNNKWVSGMKKEVAREVANWHNDDVYRLCEYLTREDCVMLSILINEYRS